MRALKHFTNADWLILAYVALWGGAFAILQIWDRTRP